MWDGQDAHPDESKLNVEQLNLIYLLVEKITLTFDQDAYRNLLADVAPKMIETEEEYDRVLAVVEQLTLKKQNSRGASYTQVGRNPTSTSDQHQRQMQRSHFSVGEDSSTSRSLITVGWVDAITTRNKATCKGFVGRILGSGRGLSSSLSISTKASITS